MNVNYYADDIKDERRKAKIARVLAVAYLALGALNLGVAAWSFSEGRDLWGLNLAVGIYVIGLGVLELWKARLAMQSAAAWTRLADLRREMLR